MIICVFLCIYRYCVDVCSFLFCHIERKHCYAHLEITVYFQAAKFSCKDTAMFCQISLSEANMQLMYKLRDF